MKAFGSRQIVFGWFLLSEFFLFLRGNVFYFTTGTRMRIQDGFDDASEGSAAAIPNALRLLEFLTSKF
jgi:hypothetical protein